MRKYLVATMAASRLGRSNLWNKFIYYSRQSPRQQGLFQSLCQKRFASYQRLPGRGPHKTQYSSRFRVINRLYYICKNYKAAIAALGAGGGVVYAYNLETVPITGRRRFNIISPEYEKKIMEGGYEQTLREYQGQILPAEHPHTRMVANVVERLLSSVKGLAGDEWRVHVINDPKQINALLCQEARCSSLVACFRSVKTRIA